MEQSQIIRLPKKYWELFSTLDNQEAWKLIKELFWYDTWVEWLTRVYRDMMKVDIFNMESSAVNWKKWWRPKKIKTPGYENEKPQVIKNDNLKEDKIIENKWNEKELREYISDKSNESITYYVIKYFFGLWWKPAEDETIETIRKWIQEVMKENGIDSSEKMKWAIDRWYEYWKWEKKQKNIKSTFRNTIKYSK